MDRVTFNRKPVADSGIRRNGIRKYIRYYNLFLTRMIWVGERESDILPEDDLKLYLSSLIDPVAFEGDGIDSARQVEEAYENLFNGEDWDGFRIETTVDESGSKGSLISKQKDAVLTTTIYTKKNDSHNDAVTIPPNGSFKSLKKMMGWRDNLDEQYSKPSSGDKYVLEITESESGRFKLYVNTL